MKFTIAITVLFVLIGLSGCMREPPVNNTSNNPVFSTNGVTVISPSNEPLLIDKKLVRTRGWDLPNLDSFKKEKEVSFRIEGVKVTRSEYVPNQQLTIEAARPEVLNSDPNAKEIWLVQRLSRFATSRGVFCQAVQGVKAGHRDDGQLALVASIAGLYFYDDVGGGIFQTLEFKSYPDPPSLPLWVSEKSSR